MNEIVDILGVCGGPGQKASDPGAVAIVELSERAGVAASEAAHDLRVRGRAHHPGPDQTV